MRLGVAALATTAVLAGISTATSSSGAAAVKPDQHFVGTVNGNHTRAVVVMVCPGPAYPGQSGHPSGGQYLATILVQSGAGYTGSAATTIIARFANDPSISVSLPAYGVAKAIPQQLALPCSGSGKVTFTPSPASSTSVADSVTVTFQNIAV
jgi:hypothetical protein